jgi:hypothetical protein
VLEVNFSKYKASTGANREVAMLPIKKEIAAR